MKVYSPNGKSYVHIAQIPKNEIDTIRFDVCAQPKETVSAYYNRQEKAPDIVANLGLFDMGSSGLPCFGLVSNFKTYAYDGLHIEGFGITSSGTLRYGRQREQSWKDFCSAYPMLIESYKKTEIIMAKELDYRTSRTCLGYTANDIYIICVDSPGMTFSELQDIGMSLHLDYMMNADGGGSTKMLVNGDAVAGKWSTRPVDNVVAVYLKHEEQKDNKFKIGDKVKVVNPLVYGTTRKFTLWFKTYEVMSISGDRAVIGVDGVITAPVNIKYIKKV